MKTKLLIAVCIASATTGALGVFTQRFTDWNDVIAKSPDIVIARCESQYRNSWEFPDGVLWGDVEVSSVLKGETKPGKARLVTQFSPQHGWRYLIIGTYQSNDLYRAYNATEDWRLIPLDPGFPVHTILDGKPLKKQIRMIFEHRLKAVTQELMQAEEEKKRLEAALNVKP